MNLHDLAEQLTEASATIRDREYLRDHGAKTIADLAAAGDTSSPDFQDAVESYQQITADLAHAKRTWNDLTALTI